MRSVNGEAAHHLKDEDTSVLTAPPDASEALGEEGRGRGENEREWLSQARHRVYRVLLRQALPLLLFILTAGGLVAIAAVAGVVGFLLGAWSHMP